MYCAGFFLEYLCHDIEVNVSPFVEAKCFISVRIPPVFFAAGAGGDRKHRTGKAAGIPPRCARERSFTRPRGPDANRRDGAGPILDLSADHGHYSAIFFVCHHRARNDNEAWRATADDSPSAMLTNICTRHLEMIGRVSAETRGMRSGFLSPKNFYITKWISTYY